MSERKIYRLDEVYGITRDVPLNYVERENVDGKLRDNLNREKHITIFGSSKQGKTCLRKHCLPEDSYILVQCNNKWSLGELNAQILKRAGYELTESTTNTIGGKAKLLATIGAKLGFGDSTIGSELEQNHGSETKFRQLELDVDDPNDIIAALQEIDFTRYIVLEDFHYLKHDVQKDFAIELKAFHESSKLCFIITGVWLDENKLVIYNGDLTGRIIPVNADSWNDDELLKVINEGAKLLHITFDSNFTNSVISHCSGNVYIVQEVCHKVCKLSGILQTMDNLELVGHNVDVKKIIQEIVREQSGRYNTFITNYSSGFQETTLEMHKWLLYPILTSTPDQLMRGLSRRFIRTKLQEKHPKKHELNTGNIIQALKSVVSLQLTKSVQPIILDYDETNSILHVVDRGFIIWLSVQNQEDLLDLADLPIE